MSCDEFTEWLECQDLEELFKFYLQNLTVLFEQKLLKDTDLTMAGFDMYCFCKWEVSLQEFDNYINSERR